METTARPVPSIRGMGVREFTDSAGTAWRVWDTVPRMGMLLPPGYADGWLTFESAIGRYRLAPVIAGWEQFTTAKLEALCRTARTSGRNPAKTANNPRDAR